MACNMMDRSALEGVQALIEKRPSGRLAAQGVNDFRAWRADVRVASHVDCVIRTLRG